MSELKPLPITQEEIEYYRVQATKRGHRGLTIDHPDWDCWAGCIDCFVLRVIADRERFALQECAKVRERAAKEMCDLCHEDWPIEHELPRFFYHCVGPQENLVCQAAPIRALNLEETLTQPETEFGDG